MLKTTMITFTSMALPTLGDTMTIWLTNWLTHLLPSGSDQTIPLEDSDSFSRGNVLDLQIRSTERLNLPMMSIDQQALEEIFWSEMDFLFISFRQKAYRTYQKILFL